MEASASTPGAAAHYSDVFYIQKFFNLASTTHEACDAKAKELFGGQVEPVVFPGACSYDIYAGRALEFVVKLRLESQPLKTEKSRLARNIYGSLVPEVSFVGKSGEEGGEKQQFYIYVMDRMRGTRHLYFDGPWVSAKHTREICFQGNHNERHLAVGFMLSASIFSG